MFRPLRIECQDAYYHLVNRGKGRRSVARQVAMKFCQDLGSARLIEIADLFGVKQYSTEPRQSIF